MHTFTLSQDRMTFVYDSNKINLLESVGEVAVPPKDKKYITLKGVDIDFAGFDRNPYLASFQAGTFKFTLVNAHLYFGEDKTS